MNNKQLWKISKYVYAEVFLESQLETQALNQAKYLESLEKNQHAMRTNDITMKISIGVMMGFLILLPIQGFVNIIKAISQGTATSWILFAGGMSFTLFFVVQMSYLLLFGMMLSSSLMGGEMFKWLYTLPLSKPDLRKIAFFTFFRSMDVQAIILLLLFPIATLIITKDLILIIASIVISSLCVLFSFSTLVFLGEKIHRVLSSHDVSSRKANFIRISTMLSYGLGSLALVFIMQYAIFYVEQYFAQPSISQSSLEWANLLFSWIPIPFAPAYLISTLTIKNDIPMSLWLTSLGGTIILLLIVIRMTRRAVAKLGSMVYTESEDFELGPKVITKDVQVQSLPPISAYIKKDLSIATRDLQMIMLLIMPLLLPSIGVLSLTMTGQIPQEFDEEMYVMLNMSLGYVMMGALMLMGGLLNVESSGSSVLSSLPIVERDIAIAKLRMMCIITIISGLTPLLFYMQSPIFLTLLVIFIVFLPIGPFFSLFGLILKVRMFGKMRYKYTLEEIHIKSKVLKWILLISLNVILYIGLFILSLWLITTYNLSIFAIGIFALETILLLVLIFIFNKMFPKPKFIK